MKRFLLKNGLNNDDLWDNSTDGDDPEWWPEGDDPKLMMTVKGYPVARDPKTNLHVLSWDEDGIADRWAVVETDDDLGAPLTEAQFRYRCRFARGVHTDG